MLACNHRYTLPPTFSIYENGLFFHSCLPSFAHMLCFDLCIRKAVLMVDIVVASEGIKMAEEGR